MAVYFSKAQRPLNLFVNNPYYELCSSRQQAVRLQVILLTTVPNFASRRRACSREKRSF
jgi:hypothetical protein